MKGRITKTASRTGLGVALVSTCLMLLSCSNPQKAKSRYLAEGQTYMKKGKYGDAAIEFRNALRIDPRFVDAYYNLAQAELHSAIGSPRMDLFKKPLSWTLRA